MMNNLPLVSQPDSGAVITPAIPLNFVYPGLSMAQILSIVKAYRKLSLFIVLTVMLLTALILTFWPRTYVATMTLMVNYEVNDPLNGKELPVGQVSSYIATQVELMQIQEVLLAVVDRLNLTQNKDYSQGYRGNGGTLREWVAIKLSKDLVIYQGQLGSQLIYVTYSANNPKEAALVANTVAEVYLTSSLNRSLQSQLAGQQARLTKLKIAFGPRHPDVVELQSQIDSTRNRLITQATINPLTGSSETTSQEALPAEYKFSSGGHDTNVSFISRATPPVKATKPKISSGYLLGALVAGLLGLGIPLGYELFNRRVRCRDDIERQHGITVLVEFAALPMHTTTLPMRSSI